jgi:hypothetical protein
MASLDKIIDNKITNNPLVNKATVLLTKNPVVILSNTARNLGLENVKVLKAPTTKFQIDQLTQQDVEYYKSSLGTPVYTDLVFEAGQYIDENNNQQSFDQIKMVTVIVTISQTKNIVKTSIQGRPGTIKEYIGMGDYLISINGVITGPNGHYPREEVQALKNMLVAPMAIKVTSWYLQLWDIDNIVVDDFGINQEEGGYSYQPFSISASSDTDVQLRLI